MTRLLTIALVLLLCSAVLVHSQRGGPARVTPPRSTAWALPPDNGTLGQDAIAAILAGDEYPVASSYTQAVSFIDFSAHGQSFTQAVITLTPDRPRLRNGRTIVVVGAEPGSEYGMDFVSTVERKEGPA